MSLITSAKSVKLQLSTSYYAQVSQLYLVSGLIWAWIYSPLPLTISFYLIGYCLTKPLSYWQQKNIFGEVELNFEQMEIYYDSLHSQNAVQIKSIETLFRMAFIVLKTSKGHWLIWRDSCQETDYRQLIVRLSQAELTRSKLENK